ncbi:hypothetical protein ASF00_16405 [Sphingomonas sp. Leaf34]|uniref:glycosyltransferase family 4 protein n=1 Tax=Sphingomonas sp. Leaf34 TaxID=1736216 RepID=UPI0006F57B5B|nr:glycosyltransferase family 1 protein [Sphingomonas sp. Leaf34]KQN24416.1 hypothetical protein ASF00_16405 [Sphingomonas sp. Leaf34]
MTLPIEIPLYAIRHGQIGGTEFAIYNLIRGLAATDVPLVLNYGRDADLSPDFLDWTRGVPGISMRRGGGLPGPKSTRFIEEALFQNRRRGDKWAIFPNYFCPPALVGRRGRNCVILHDIQYKRYPEYHSPKRRAWLDFYLPRMLRSADAIILISQSELSLVREYFGEAIAARCDVVPNAIDFVRLQGGTGKPSAEARQMVGKRYILSVCHQFPHKNVPTLLAAFANVAQRDPSLQLYLVGSSSAANRDFVRAASTPAIIDRVHLTGFVSDADLGLLYAHAQLFVLPSLYEGFGMPAVESLGLGIPTLVSNAYALPEVTLGHAGVIDQPRDPAVWADAIEAALASGNRPSSAAIAEIRATYEPATVARKLVKVLSARG